MICTRAEVLVAMGKTTSISEADLALLDMVHPLAESVLKNYLQQSLALATVVEFLPIGMPDIAPDSLADNRPINFQNSQAVFHGGQVGKETLQLKHLPVLTTGLEVREDLDAYAGQSSDAFNSDSVLTLGVDYFLDLDSTGISRTGLLYRVGAWPAVARTVKVTYLSGWTEAQLNSDAAGAIKLAAIETVAAAFKRQKEKQKSSGPKISESIGKYSYSTSAAFAADAAGLTNNGIPSSAIAAMQPYRHYGRLFA